MSMVSYFWSHKYAVYVLVTMMLTYLMNQLHVFSLIATNGSMSQEIQYGNCQCDVKPENVTDVEEYLITIDDNATSATDYCQSHYYLCSDDSSWCYWRYLGTGLQYQLLAGPMFIVIFAISGVPLGLITELNRINRKLCLTLCVFLWSSMVILCGFSRQYWHIAVSRLLLGIFSAACVPFCSSLITDYFPAAYRGTAMGFFYWGVFVGYSFSFLLILLEKVVGWRWVYFIMGLPGLLMALIIVLSVKEPDKAKEETESIGNLTSMVTKLRVAAGHFSKPALLALCLGGAIRNGAGIVWAYNIVPYFAQYYPSTNVVAFMSWIPLVFGSAGAFGGGYVSDKMTRGRGVTGRLIVLISCCVIAAPFQAGVLLLPPPWAFLSHSLGCLFGEAWLGVCAAIVVELVPIDLTASAIAVYFFIIQVIGGNMNLLIEPLCDYVSMRLALLICFPGFYFVAAIIFLVTLLLHNKFHAEKSLSEAETNACEEKLYNGATQLDVKL